jgi:predicted outer membrane protein
LCWSPDFHPAWQENLVLTQIIKFGALGGAGYAAWRAFRRRQPPSFFAQALQTGATEVEAARSGQLRGASAALRGFALELEREHERRNERLVEASGLEIPPPGARQRATLRSLDLHQGAAHDRAWLRHMRRSLREAIALYEREVVQDGPGAAVAVAALPALREHARRIEELRQERAQPVGLHGERWPRRDEPASATWSVAGNEAEAGARG